MILKLRKYIVNNQITITTTLTVCLYASGLVLTLHPQEWDMWYVKVVFFLQFPFFYILFGFFIDRFVESRIKLVYKSIYTRKKMRKDFLKRHRKDGLKGVEEEVKQWMEKRESEMERLSEMEAYRRNFVGSVSHELRTPTFNMQGYITTLLDGAMYDEKVNRAYLERTLLNIKRMIEIIDDLGIISRLENHEVTPQCKDEDLSDLIKEIVREFEMRANEYGVRLEFRNKMKYPPIVYAESKSVQLILTNLIENAMRYRSEKDPYIKISIYDMHEKVFVEVSDNGIGISESDLPHVFERFYRADQARTREKGGSGLGLAIVKHVLEAQNQNISIRSALGEGTTIGFTLDKSEIRK